ncbi:hypothetical protein T4E_12371, partial [Trichinella pseudospiralis]
MRKTAGFSNQVTRYRLVAMDRSIRSLGKRAYCARGRTYGFFRLTSLVLQHKHFVSRLAALAFNHFHISGNVKFGQFLLQ